MKVNIVIVNYRKHKETGQCLDLIKSYLPNKYQNIILVDNESTKQIDLIKERFPQIIIIKNLTNFGFARGVNQGIKYALTKKADYILLLNNDTEFNCDFVSSLLSSKNDLVSPILKFKRRGEWVYDFGGKINWLIGRPFHLISKKIVSCQLSVVSCQLDYVSGCCLLIKREVFEKIGLFDEQYFLYFEDVDFCLKAKKAGFSLGIEPKTILIHHLEEKKSATRLFKLKELLKSQLLFIRKWVTWYYKPLAFIYWWWLKTKIR